MTTTTRTHDDLLRSTETRFEAGGARSLVWDGDALVDWVNGGTRWTPQGERHDSSARYAFSFDMAVTLPGSGYSVVYKRLGTKGLLLKDGRVVRDIDRSYYHAEDYEYPIALFRLPSGRPAIVHCPQDYNRLRIDDLETGAVLASATEEAGDFFHSRLSVSPDGRWLASAGWMWHPVDDIALYDLEAALADPATLDRGQGHFDVMTENGNAAAFDVDSRLLMTFDRTGWEDEETGALGGIRLMRLTPGLAAAPESRLIELDGAFMPVGTRHVLLLGACPRLLSIETGRVVATWPEVALRVPASAIQSGTVDFTPLDCDAPGSRIAIAHDEMITILRFHP